MLVYGKKILEEIDFKKIKKVYISRKEYITFLNDNKIKYEFVTNSVLDNKTKGNHQGIAIDIFDYEYKDMKSINSEFILILDHIEDPHNFGAIIRSAASAGITDIIIPKDRAVLVNDTVIKVSAGTAFKVNIILVTNLVNAIKELQNKNYFIYASHLEGEDYKTLDYSGKKALIIGNEGKGISRLVKDTSDQLVRIPMANNIDSLNASVAAGILIFEMRN